MAGTMKEFDEPCEMRSAFCAMISEEDYEKQAFTETEKALNDLLSHLDQNPEIYATVLKKKRRQEAENAGWISYAKVKLFSYFSDDHGFSTPTKEECSNEFQKLKDDMINLHQYSSKGQRFSARLAEKRRRAAARENHTPNRTVPIPPPPPPPVPPPPPMSRSATSFVTPLTRKALRDQQKKTKEKSKLECSNRMKPADQHGDFISQLSGQNLRKRLRQTEENRSPGGTPAGGWKKKRQPEPEMISYFNAKLLDKFKLIRSPTPNSPSSSSVLESPNSFLLD